MIARFMFAVILAWALVGSLPCRAHSQTGWLVLQPPVDDDKVAEFETALKIPELAKKAVELALLGMAVKKDPPLRAWDQVSAYDSAADCEAAKIESLAQSLETVSKFGANKLALISAISFARMRASRCLPSSVILAPSR